MDFDDAKENIQPLAQGRNASILHASLRVESTQELVAQRKMLEKEINTYNGDDPLSVWYNYIEWIEQSFPSGGKESGLEEVLIKCLRLFETDQRYKQDRRMVKLYIKFFDSHKNAAEYYQQLFNEGIGTMVADFYIAWAYCYDLVGNTRKADEIFLRGIACRAQPLDELQEARQHFGFSVAQRLMYKEDDCIKEETNRQLYERRMALTSLRARNRKQMVSSVRTGAAIKTLSPGKVQIDLPSTSSKRGNKRVQVFKDENEQPNAILMSSREFSSANEVGKSVVRSVIDATRNQENEKEPGPWNKAYTKGTMFDRLTKTNELGFEIHEDDHDYENQKQPCIPPIPIADNDIKFDKPIIYPQNFCAISKPIKGWITPVTTEEMPDKNTLPEYDKCKLYPRPNVEFQPEELKAYNILKKRGIQNKFTKEREEYWGCGPNYNIRLYPHFATKSKPQTADSIDQFFIPEKLTGLKVDFDELYKTKEKIERQFEEILALRFKRSETIMETADMEETMCTNEKIQRRKSFFPIRKSLATAALKTLNKISILPEQNYESIVSEMSSIPPSSAKEQTPTEYEFYSKPYTLNKNKSQQEISPTGVEINSEEKFSDVILQQCEKIVSDTVLPQPFEIYKDDSTVKVNCIQAIHDGNDFRFKTPALPVVNSTAVMTVPNKLPFEIFDENLVQQSPNSITKMDCSAGTGTFYDPDETCSTQTFNIFLKAQSASTPKVIVKTKPQRHFGNVLKEVTPPTMQELKDDVTDNQNSIADNQNFASVAQPVSGFSPPRQQLSTILETSEHGTTQGTHTTGATTKSTLLSSPEIDIDSQVQSTTNTGTNHLQNILETVHEFSCESSVIVDKMIKSPKIQNMDANTEETHTSQKYVETPGAMRLKNKCATDCIDSYVTTVQRQVGNFSRLEEKEDTLTGFVLKTLPTIHFQDDKTETISKMFATSQQFKFQDDRTETIPQIMLQPILPSKIQEDNIETIPKMLLASPTPIKLAEDKTETISNFMLSPQKIKKLDDEETETKTRKKNMDEDDSFEFFGQTPPKPVKYLATKQIERGALFNIRTAVDNRTPLKFESKGFCDKDTQDTQKTSSPTKPIVLFEDELQSHLKNKLPNSITNDLFLPDFPHNVKSNSKFFLRDSSIPNFSILEDSQPQINKSESQQIKINDSILPDFTLMNITQSKPVKPGENNSKNISLLSEFVHVSEIQPNDSIVKSSQSLEYSYAKQCSKHASGAENCLNENKINYNINWNQTHNRSQETQDKKALENIFIDTFVKDFSEINGPPINNAVNQVSIVKPNKSNSSLRFLNESSKQKAINPRIITENNSTICNIPINNKETTLNLLTPITSKEKLFSNDQCLAGCNNEKYFELNCETETFSTNNSMIKNSTLLPNHRSPIIGNVQQLSQIQEKSLHIKSEDVSSNFLTPSKTHNQILKVKDSTKSKHSLDVKSLCKNYADLQIVVSESEAINIESFSRNKDKSFIISESPEDHSANDDNEMSIYYKETPKTPKSLVHIWNDPDVYKTASQNQYVHVEPDLDQTRQIIENLSIDPNVNPFNIDLINAFLEQHYVISYLESLPTCKLVGDIHRLKKNASIDINGNCFEVIKLIGEGAYGAVFCGTEKSTAKLVAMKQEKPPNLWEYYICLEIRERIRTDEMLQSYMSVDYALIGNNASILISKFSQYGSLITVCNKIKKHTMKNMDEYVVMLLASELLEIMDHLHAVNIIHADVKPDNFLLMHKLTYPPTERHLQLIDFGVSIDMKLFKEGQTFSFVHNDNLFKCPEMRERRPWTYQLDLYGLAGIIHVLLFGKYMDIEKKARGYWMHKTHVPRYLNRNLWEEIFKTLLNIRDCKSMPNLQDLRALLKKEMEDKEKYVLRMVNEFNRALFM